MAIEPEDRSWIVFVPSEGDALFYRRFEFRDEEGKIEHAYADVELPGSFPLEKEPQAYMPAPVSTGQEPIDKEWPGPIDFHVEEGMEPCMDALSLADHAREEELFPNRRKGYYAFLNCRSVVAWGETPHQAVQSLLNYAVKLAAAGSLDHTGRGVRRTSSARRYEAVWGYKPERACAATLEEVPQDRAEREELKVPIREYPEGRCEAKHPLFGQCENDSGHKRWHEAVVDDDCKSWVNEQAAASLV
jgi:hypothetical protein